MSPLDATTATPDWAGVEPPLRVENADKLVWDDVADTVVVGFGGAGACAALEARERGASVIVVERFEGGGSTAFSGGVVYAGGTRVQAEAGFPDSAEEMFNYLALEVGDAVTPRTLRRFCDGSAADIDWLMRHGVDYNRKGMTGKTAYPPDEFSLYYSGNEKVPRYRAKAAPAPRGHRTIGKSFSGYAFFGALKQAALRAGVQLIIHAPVRRLVTDQAGNVLGVEARILPETDRAEHSALYGKVLPLPFKYKTANAAIAACRTLEREAPSRPRFIRARGGVILAAGGFIRNEAMLARHRPALAAFYKAVIPLAAMGDDGAGIALGESAGGKAAMLENIFVNRLIAPPDAPLKGAAVNLAGERFINEDAYCGFLGSAIANQPGGEAWLILDNRGFWRIVKQCILGDRSLFKLFLMPTLLNLFIGGTRLSFSLAGLARKCKIVPQTLEKTIAAYNAGAKSGADALGKSPDQLSAIEAKPYFAVNLAIGNPFGFVQLFTLGGLTVDEETGAVLNGEGGGIEGLYAAGRNAVGLCSQGYLSGMSLADCVFSGRRAGASTAGKAAGAPAARITVRALS